MDPVSLAGHSTVRYREDSQAKIDARPGINGGTWRIPIEIHLRRGIEITEAAQVAGLSAHLDVY